jgi:hypothetical protein
MYIRQERNFTGSDQLGEFLYLRIDPHQLRKKLPASEWKLQ